MRTFAVTMLARILLGQAAPAVARSRKAAGRRLGRWERLVREPRSTVLLVLFSILLIGGVRKLRQGWRAREAIARLDDPSVSPEAIRAAADHRRAGLMELFRLLSTAESQAQRDAAGQALSVLWARDELIAEEEKALVRRAVQVHWKARRRYPRALRAPIPIEVTYEVPFLSDDEEESGVRPDHLEWSHRITGARRANLLEESPWVAGRGSARFELIPDDFETDGPHQLVLQPRVRTRGLTDNWELDLPHIPFRFEFDPNLAVDALFALPDDARAAACAAAVRLVPGVAEGGPAYLALNDALAIVDPPAIELALPLPCDLAHRIEIEFQGVEGRFAAGSLTLSGQGQVAVGPGSTSTQRIPIGPLAPIPGGAIERPGRRPIRVRLVPDPDRGWADPDVRSIWPDAIETNWIEIEVVRR